MAGKGLQDDGIFCPFFEHLRRSLDEVVLQIASRPLRASAKNSVQQMPVFVKEGDYVLAFHQARPTIRGLGEVTDQHVLRRPKALLAGGQVERGVMLVFVLPWKHVEINPAKQLATVEDVVNRNIGMPDLSRGYAPVGDAIHVAGKVEDAL